MGWDHSSTTTAIYDPYVKAMFGSVHADKAGDKDHDWKPVKQENIGGHFRAHNNANISLTSPDSNLFDFGAFRAAMYAYNSSQTGGIGAKSSSGREAGTGSEFGIHYVKGPWWWAYNQIAIPNGDSIFDDPKYMAYRNPLLGFGNDENQFSTASLWRAFSDTTSKKNEGMMGALEAIEKDIAFKEGVSSLPYIFGENTKDYFDQMTDMVIGSDSMVAPIDNILNSGYIESGETDPYAEVKNATEIDTIDPESFVGDSTSITVLESAAFDIDADIIDTVPLVDVSGITVDTDITHPDLDEIEYGSASTLKTVTPGSMSISAPTLIARGMPEVNIANATIDSDPIEYQVEAIYFTSNEYTSISQPGDVVGGTIAASTAITAGVIPKGSITAPLAGDSIFIGDIDDLTFEDLTNVGTLIQPSTEDATATDIVPPVLDPDSVYKPSVPDVSDYGEVVLPATDATSHEVDLDVTIPEDYLPAGYSPVVADEITLSKGKVLPGVIDLSVYDAILRADIDAAVSALRDSLTLRYSEEESNMRRSLSLGRRGLSSHFDRARAILAANKESQVNQYEKELVIDAMKANVGLASTAADLETRANIASAENYLRTLLGYAENGVRLIVSQFEGWVRASLQNADLKTRVSMTNYENAVRAAISTAENLTRMSAAVLEAGTSVERVLAENSLRAQISKTEIALQAASTIAQLGTQVAMANKDAYNRASIAYAENSLRAALTTTESRVRVALALQEDISRTNLANHDAATKAVLTKFDSDLKAEIAYAENALRAAISNREITSSENIAQAENVLKAALASYDGKIRTIIADAENKVRVMTGNQDAKIRAGELAVREGLALLETEFKRLIANQDAYLRISLGKQETWARIQLSEFDASVRAAIADQENDVRAQIAVLETDSRLAIATAENATRANIAQGESILRLKIGEQDILVKAALAEHEGLLRAAFENHGAELKVAIVNQETAMKAALANQDSALRFDLAYRDSMLKARLSTQDASVRASMQDKEMVMKAILADQDIRHKYDAMEQQRLLDDITMKQNLSKALYDVYLGWMRSYENHLSMIGSMVAEGMRKHTAELISDREMLVKSETLRWDVMQQRAAFIEGLAGLKWQSQLQNMSVIQQASASLGQATGVRETPSQFTRKMQTAGFLMDAIGGLTGLITAVL
jgi:hypothetical protein